jgi:hypothetical protein
VLLCLQMRFPANERRRDDAAFAADQISARAVPLARDRATTLRRVLSEDTSRDRDRSF